MKIKPHPVGSAREGGVVKKYLMINVMRRCSHRLRSSR